MDSSYQAVAAILTQEYTSEYGDIRDMPIADLSVQFSNTQFKWSTVVKEGYAIYYAIKKSDAKSLQKFLAGRTNNVILD